MCIDPFSMCTQVTYSSKAGLCYCYKMQDYPGLKDAIVLTLRKLREGQNLSKRQMAQKALLERVYLIQLEKGQKRPSINALFYISNALNIKPSEVIRMIEEELEIDATERGSA